MVSFRFALALLCAALSLAAQVVKSLPAAPFPEPDAGRYSRLTGPYQDLTVDSSRFTDSSRWDRLLRSGNLYLSLHDAIALGLENNLDLELQRYNPRIADTDLRRASGGGLLRYVPLATREGPAGVGPPRQPDQPAPTSTAGQPQPDVVSSSGPESTLSLGPVVPLLDPAIVGTLSYNHRNQPQQNAFITGTDQLLSNSTVGNLSLQKGFLSGAVAGVTWDNNRISSNNGRNDLNPNSTSSMGFTITQPLLRGFGPALNNRFVRIAKLNRKVVDYGFKLQAVATVFAVTRLYWDLVTLIEDFKVKQQSLELAEKLQSNNQQQVDAGTLAPIEVVRARAEVARARRDLTISQTQVLQQETTLKDFLSRTAMRDPVLAQAHIICTDSIQIPAQDQIQPIDDLVELATRQRPDIAQALLQLEESNIVLKGSRAALLPEIDLIASADTNSLAGRLSTLPTISTSGSGTPLVRNPDPTYLGGFGTGLSQLFTGKFPDYGIGVQVNIPIFNHVAQADLVRDKLQVRQQEVRIQQLRKQIKVEITNAVIALQQARAVHQASQEQRILQEQSLDAEQQKYEVGASTSYLVIQYQRDLAQARTAEVVADSDYVRAKNTLDRVLGQVLSANGVLADEAYTGEVKQ